MLDDIDAAIAALKAEMLEKGYGSVVYRPFRNQV